MGSTALHGLQQFSGLVEELPAQMDEARRTLLGLEAGHGWVSPQSCVFESSFTPPPDDIGRTDGELVNFFSEWELPAHGGPGSGRAGYSASTRTPPFSSRKRQSASFLASLKLSCQGCS